MARLNPTGARCSDGSGMNGYGLSITNLEQAEGNDFHPGFAQLMGHYIGAMKTPTPEQGWSEPERHAWSLKPPERVQYQPLVDAQAADPPIGSLAGLPGPTVWAWYGL